MGRNQQKCLKKSVEITTEWIKEEMVEKECCQRTREDKEQGRNAVVFIVFSIYRKERSPQAPVFLLGCFMHHNQTSSSSSSNPPRTLLTPL